MGKPKLAPGAPYKGRRADKVVRVLTLDREADGILQTYCPPETKQIGAFLSRLIYEHEARMEERQRRREEGEKNTTAS